MIFNFPDKNQSYLQTNRSDSLGSLWSTLNLDFQNDLGTMQVTPRLRINTSTADSASMTSAPRAFKFLGVFWTISGNRVFNNTSSSADDPFSVNTDASFQTTYNNQSDLEVFNGNLFSTTQTEVWSLSSIGGTWMRRGGVAPLGNVFHGMKYFKKFNRLYVIGDVDKIYSFDTAYSLATSGDYALLLNTNQTIQITSMTVTSQSIWIGTTAFLNQIARGVIFEWDGISAQPTNQYILDATSCEALTNDNDIPYAMDGNGCLLKFTGSSFEEIGRLPGIHLDATLNSLVSSFIHPNGLLPTKNNTILALVNNLTNDASLEINENLPAGVWEFSTDFGPTHKYAVTYNRIGSSSITDYGQNRIYKTGALANADSIYTPALGTNPTVILGVQYYTNATNLSSAICVDDRTNTIQKKGYFVTTWFTSQQIEDKWERLWAVFKRVDTNSSFSIVFKYRQFEQLPVYASITWIPTIISYWKLDGNSNDAIGSDNGVDTAITYSTANGKILQGAGFNGTTSKIIGSSVNVPVNTSISCWFKTSQSGIGDDKLLFGFTGGGTNTTLVLRPSDGSIIFENLDSNSIEADIFSTSTGLNDGNWHFLVGTRTSSGVSLYIDGVLQTSFSAAFTGNFNGETMCMGNQNSGPDFFLGSLDECGYWAKALTAIEISNLYNNGAGLPFSSSNGTYFPLTSFTTTTDVSGYGPTAAGFNGTIGGEVEGIQGTGSGQCAHITSVVNNAGTYTVTLDTLVMGASGTAVVRFQKWIKLYPELADGLGSIDWGQLAIGANSPRIQIKGCFTFTDNGTNCNEFIKLALFSNEDIKITA